MSHSEVLLNAYVDIGTWGGFTPFVGAGVGKGWRSAKNALGTFSESKVAWAGMIGVAFNLSESIKFDFGYRYLNTGKAVNAAIGYRRPFEAHELRIGVRYLFD
jgi:opacity protein-like surface antigen